MKTKKIMKIAILVSLIHSAIQGQNQQKEREGISKRILFTTYRRKDGKPMTISPELLLKKVNLEVESKVRMKGAMNMTQSLKHKRFQINFFYHKQIAKNIYTQIEKWELLHVSFPFYPNSSYLNQSLLYAVESQNNLLRLNASSVEKDKNYSLKSFLDKKSLKRNFQVKAILGNFTSPKQCYLRGRLSNFTTEWKEIRIFELSADETRLREILIPSTIDPPKDLSVNMGPLLLFGFIGLVIQGFLLGLIDENLPKIWSSRRSNFPFFGLTLIQLSDLIFLLIWSIKMIPITYFNIAVIVVLMLPGLALLFLFLALSLKEIKARTFFDLISILVAFVRFTELLKDYELVEYSAVSQCLVLCFDLMSYKRGSIRAAQVTALDLWLIFCLFSGLSFFQIFSILSFFSDFNDLDISDTSVQKSLGSGLPLVILSFILFLLKFRRVVGKKKLCKSKRGYTKPVRLKGSIMSSKTVVICKSITKKKEAENEEKSEEDLDMSGSSSSTTFENSFEEEKDGGIVQREYHLNNFLVRSPDQYIALRDFQQGSSLELIVNKRKKWTHYISSYQFKFGFISSNVWLGEERVTNMIALYRNSEMKIDLIDLAKRKVLISLKMKGPDDNDACLRLRCFSILGVWIWGGKRRRFMVLTVDGSEVSIWREANVGSMILNKEIGVETSYDLSIPEMSYRELGDVCRVVFYDNLIALMFMWVDDEQYDRDVINMAKFQTIVIVEVNERERSVKEIRNLSKITEGMFSSWRIDSFFFIDKHTLAVIMKGRVLIVDWKKVEIKRCIKLVGLPGIKEGDDWFRTSLIYWSDTNNEVVLFRAGMNNGNYFEDGWTYFSSITNSKHYFTYSGYFTLGELNESPIIRPRERHQYQKIPEASRLILDG